MAILLESPWYQQIEQQGEIRALADIQMTLEVKFGNPGLDLMPQINQISALERLTEIFRGILTANKLEDVQQLL